MGPTASGKSELALELAQALDAELVSVDSAMVYRGLDIGTAKPSAEARRRIPHHLVDILDPGETYSAARFRRDALAAVEDITGRGRLPLLVGGTMLYFRSLEQGLAPLPSADPETRRRISDQAAALGWPAMHERLARVDAQAARRIHPNDSQRIQRALEVWETTGRPLSEHHADAPSAFPYERVKIALAPGSRARLRERIAQRFDDMLTAGLVDEVRTLMARRDLDPEAPALRAVGYRQIRSYLTGEMTYEAAVRRGIYATRQLAKRQLTWLRREPDVHWLDSESPQRRAQALRILQDS